MVKKSSKQRRQERLVVIGAFFIIVLSVLVTLWLSGVGRQVFTSQGEYKNITFTDAVLACEKQARAQFGSKLLRLTPDDHSNRLDQSSNQYLIFFYAVMTSTRNNSGVGNFYVRCYVNAAGGKVEEFEAAEQQEAESEAIRKDDGNMFGWPR